MEGVAMSPWAFLAKLYKPRDGWLLTAFVCLAITWLSAAALLAVSGWFITACAMAGLGLIVNLNIFTPSAAIRALALLRTAGRYAERVIGHEAILRILADLRVRSFAALANRPARSIEPGRHAELVNRLTSDVDTLDGVPLRVIGPLFAALMTWITVVIVGLVWAGAAVALVIGFGGALIFAVALWCAHAGRRRGQAVIVARAAQRVAASDHLGGLAELTAFQKTRQSTQTLNNLDQAQTERLIIQERYASWSEHGVQALTAGMTLVVLALAWQTLQAPVATLLALMTLGMNEALGALPGAFWRIGESTEAATRLMKLEQATPETSNTPMHKPASAQQCTTSALIDGLICQRQPVPGLKLDVELALGQPLIVHGRSGIGKTSLLATMAGELAPLSGTLHLGATNLLALPDSDRYQLVGFLSQNDQLLDVSIREFLCLGLGPVDEEKLKQALHAVDLLETLENTSEGFDYRLGVGGTRISGGQARRLQLAALLLRNQALVLLDEPFRGLQASLVQTIIARIEPWLAERCCVIVTHDPNALPKQWPRIAWPLIRTH